MKVSVAGRDLKSQGKGESGTKRMKHHTYIQEVMRHEMDYEFLPHSLPLSGLVWFLLGWAGGEAGRGFFLYPVLVLVQPCIWLTFSKEVFKPPQNFCQHLERGVC